MVSKERHGQERYDQRGFQTGNIEFILECGSRLGAQETLLTRADRERVVRVLKRRMQALQQQGRDLQDPEIRVCRRQMQRCERLVNTKVVLNEWGQLKTIYKSRPSEQKRAMRRGRASGDYRSPWTKP